MSVEEPERVVCRSQNLLLVDVPGVNDHPTAESLAAGESAVDYNLKILRNRLNDGGAYVVFIVVDPCPNGTIRAKNLALMKLILGSIEAGPRIGLIMTLIHKDCFDTVTAPMFMSTSLRRVGADLGFFAVEDHLFLRKHGDEFSERELRVIRRYILGFEPRQVRIREVPSNGLSLTVKVERPLVSTQGVRYKFRTLKTMPQESVIFIGKDLELARVLSTTFWAPVSQVDSILTSVQATHNISSALSSATGDGYGWWTFPPFPAIIMGKAKPRAG